VKRSRRPGIQDVLLEDRPDGVRAACADLGLDRLWTYLDGLSGELTSGPERLEPLAGYVRGDGSVENGSRGQGLSCAARRLTR